MIQLPRKQSRKQIMIIIIVSIVVAVALGAGTYAFYRSQQQVKPSSNHQPSTPPTLPKPTDRLHVEPHDHDPGAQQHGVDDVHTSDESAGAAAFPTTQPNLVVEITNTQQNNNQFTIGTTVTPKADGSCIIELSRANDAPFKKTTSLTTSDDTSRCKDTTLNLEGLPRGEWSLTVKVQVGSNVATATKSVTLK